MDKENEDSQEAIESNLGQRVLAVILVPLVVLATWVTLDAFEVVFNLSYLSPLIDNEQVSSDAAQEEPNAAQVSPHSDSVENEIFDTYLEELSAELTKQWEALPSRTIERGEEGLINLPSEFGSGLVGITVDNAVFYQSFDEFTSAEHFDSDALFDSMDSFNWVGIPREQIESSRVISIDVSIRNESIEYRTYYSNDGTSSIENNSLSFSPVLLEGHRSRVVAHSIDTQDDKTVSLSQGERTYLHLSYVLEDDADISKLCACWQYNMVPDDSVSEVVLFDLGL